MNSAHSSIQEKYWFYPQCYNVDSLMIVKEKDCSLKFKSINLIRNESLS